MSAASFTPGPWRVEEGTTLVWGACNPDDRTSYGMGYPVTQARVRLGSASEYASEFREDEAEANALLIAAAPELYQEVEFLCARLRELETMILDDKVGNEYYGHVAPSRARLEMLLEKARGDQ